MVAGPYQANLEGVHDHPAGWRDRVRGWFAPSYEEIPIVRRREFTSRQEPQEPIRLLAKGDAYDFQIFPTFDWRAVVTGQDEVDEGARELRSGARRRAVSVLRPLARNFAPHQALDFEEAANRRCANENWSLTYGSDSFTLTMSFRIIPDDQVQQRLKPYWDARIEAECAHQLSLDRARYVDALTREWSLILERLEKDPRTMHAAKLSEAEFALVFAEFAKGKEGKVKELITLLQSALRANGEVGLGPSEFTRAWDDALKAFRRLHDLNADPDS